MAQCSCSCGGVMTQQGLVKGSAPATPEVVERMAETVKTVVAGR